MAFTITTVRTLAIDLDEMTLDGAASEIDEKIAGRCRELIDQGFHVIDIEVTPLAVRHSDYAEGREFNYSERGLIVLFKLHYPSNTPMD